MTDYEVISLAAELSSLLESHFMNFVTIYFAVVVASYFVAQKLPWAVLIIVLVMFTGFTILNLSIVDGLAEQEATLLTHYATSSDSLHPLWKGEVEQGALAIAGPISFAAMYFLGYFSAIGFALYLKITRTGDS